MKAAERLAQKIESLIKMFTDAEPASLRAGYLAALGRAAGAQGIHRDGSRAPLEPALQ